MQRLVIVDGMAKSNKDIFKEAAKLASQPELHFFAIEWSELNEIIMENIKAQEASLRTSRLLAEMIIKRFP